MLRDLYHSFCRKLKILFCRHEYIEVLKYHDLHGPVVCTICSKCYEEIHWRFFNSAQEVKDLHPKATSKKAFDLMNSQILK